MNSDDPDGWSFICAQRFGPTATPGMGEITTSGGFSLDVFFVSVFFVFVRWLCFFVLRVRLRGNSYEPFSLTTYPCRNAIYVLYGVCCAYILLVLLGFTIHAYKNMFIFSRAIKYIRHFNAHSGEG